MKIGCVVKAAGKSSRFKASGASENKLLADLCGKPVLAHVLDALPKDRFVRLIVVVSNAETDALCRARGVETLMYSGGPVSETVRLGLAVVMGDVCFLDGCMFIAGDQPLLTCESCVNLITAFESAPDCIHRLAFNGVPGAPVIFPRRLFVKLSNLTGEHGGRSTMVGEDVRFVNATRLEELQDADTKEALDALKICYLST